MSHIQLRVFKKKETRHFFFKRNPFMKQSDQNSGAYSKILILPNAGQPGQFLGQPGQ